MPSTANGGKVEKYFRTDLACEVSRRLGKIEGTEYSEDEKYFCRIERLKIKTESASKKLGRPIGSYVTVFTQKLWILYDDELSAIAEIIAKELRPLILSSTSTECLTEDLSVLVVGLGNSSITADAIGPEALARLTATRHVKIYDEEIFKDLGLCEISAIAPGVLGKTGIETLEMIKAAVNEVRPNIVIAIDALAAGDIERLATTIQISSTGINPGAGIGNLRSGLNEDTLGVPVISIGVPTVADSSTIIYDAFSKAEISELPTSIQRHLDNCSKYYVTPKESDLITEKASIIISRAITDALSI